MVTVLDDNLDLQIARKRLNVKQKHVAKALGVAISTVSDFENGERADLPREQGRAEYERFLARVTRVGVEQAIREFREKRGL